MYRHLCLPTDGSPLSDHAVEHALALAKSMQARVTLLSVTPPFHLLAISPELLQMGNPAEYQRITRESTLKYLGTIEARAQAMGVGCDLVVVEDDAPWQAIISTAKERGCDLIAMASHGRRGIKALVLGSETLKVLTHSTIPVLVYRQT